MKKRGEGLQGMKNRMILWIFNKGRFTRYFRTSGGKPSGEGKKRAGINPARRPYSKNYSISKKYTDPDSSSTGLGAEITIRGSSFSSIP